MKRLARIVSIMTLAAAGLFTAPSVSAQTARAAIRQQLSGEAQLSWDGAIELYEAGDYEGALVQFKRAHDLSKNPQVLFDVGLCLKNMARYAQAIAAWERELSHRQSLPRADVEALETAIETLRPFVSTLEINVSEPGAVIRIDGEDEGRSPVVRPIPINVGRRVVRVTKLPEFLPSEHTIDVAKGQPVKLEVRLEPAVRTALVAVTATGAEGVTLFLDGRELGVAPFRGQVPTGVHTFVARAPGYREALKTIELAAGEPRSLTLALVRERNEGRLRVQATPPDALISIEGQSAMGAWDGLLPAGGHQLRITRDGYQDYVTDVSLSPGQERSLQVELTKNQSWIWWTVTLAAVVGGGTLATVLLLEPADTTPVSGTLQPYLVGF